MNSEARALAERWRSELGNRLAAFWSWWSGELTALIPARWRTRLQGRERRLLYRDGAFELTEGSAPLRVPLAQVAQDPTLATWRTLDAGRMQLLLLLAPQELLRKVIALPAATEPRLAAVLGFELDRHTPFSAAEASFGYRIVGRDRAAQRISVELYVLPAVRCQQLLDALAQAGLRPSWILPAGSEQEISARQTLNLLPQQQRARPQRTLRSRPVLVVLLLALAIGVLFSRREARIEELQTQVGPQQQAAEQVQALRAQIDRLQAGSRFLLERKRAQPAVLVLLDELTRRLPDDTWLNRLELSGSELRLQGESASASGLIALLEQSPLLAQVGFSSPVTINPRSRQERFSLDAQIEPPPAGGWSVEPVAAEETGAMTENGLPNTAEGGTESTAEPEPLPANGQETTP